MIMELFTHSNLTILSTDICVPTFAREELMFSMFSMLLMQLLGTLLQARRMKSQKLRWPSNQLPEPAKDVMWEITFIYLTGLNMSLMFL